MDLQDKKEQKKKGALMPIIDGDARPDIQTDVPSDKPLPTPEDQDEDPLTENRSGDTDTLEDYKDAKKA